MLKAKTGVKKKELPASQDLKKFDKVSKTAPQVRVGYPASELGGRKYPGSVAPVISVAVWNEFGTKNIPARSFLRSVLAERRREHRNAIRKIAEAGIRGGDMLKLLNVLGLQVVGQIQQRITSLREPPNKPSTIRRKKTDNPLIDTGFLRSSTTFELRRGKNGKTKKD